MVFFVCFVQELMFLTIAIHFSCSSIKHGLPDDDDVFGPPDGAELADVRAENGNAAGQERSPLVKFAPTHDVLNKDEVAEAEEGAAGEEKAAEGGEGDSKA